MTDQIEKHNFEDIMDKVQKMDELSEEIKKLNDEINGIVWLKSDTYSIKVALDAVKYAQTNMYFNIQLIGNATRTAYAHTWEV